MKEIYLKGVHTHNLKEIDVRIPRNKITVITGPSGSGKSSLAFDTIFAEGQRRYVESLSPYARNFLNRMPKPDVEKVEGLSPTIAIDQKSMGVNPRSTVGTSAQIYDFLRLLYAKTGEPRCVKCNKKVTSMTIDQMVDEVMALPDGSRFSVLAPVVKKEKGDFAGLFSKIKRQGFVRVLLDDEVVDLDDEIKINKKRLHSISVYVDRLVKSEKITNRLADSMELALGLSKGVVVISPVEGDDITFTDKLTCVDCKITIPNLTASLFSFNNPKGACPNCDGIGKVYYFDEFHVIPDQDLSLKEGAVEPWTKRNSPYYRQLMDSVCKKYKIDPFCPWKDLPLKSKKLLLGGTGDELEFLVKKDDRQYSFKRKFEGIIPNLDRRRVEYERKKIEGQAQDHDYLSDEFHKYMKQTVCPKCNGAKLKPESIHVFVENKNIFELTSMTLKKCLTFLNKIKFKGHKKEVAEHILKEIDSKLGFLLKVGVGYITLDRPTSTLSGGEAQRIRLATQIGSSLVGVTYILDEPTIGLHQRDNDKLIQTLKDLKNAGNTVIVVEHDPDTIKAADYVVDIGPGAGIAGGRIIAEGTPSEIMANNDSITGRYLSGREKISVKTKRRKATSKALVLKGACTNNLKNIDVRIPLGLFVVVTGVSGSGKSSLISDTLLPALKMRVYNSSPDDLKYDELTGIHNVDKVINVSQSPIGRTPRSNPATFTGVFTFVREFFSTLPESKSRGFKPGRYSFNVKGGRCEACQGDGMKKIQMNFLPDMFVMCEVCKAKRYNRETLEIKYKGKSIADILDMTVNQAYSFLINHPKIATRLSTIQEVGLGYLKLGQIASTLSGGEAQRIKLAKELGKKSTARTVYILDEPTTGLHFNDIKQLMNVLEKLVDGGNTVIVIEHNLDVIKCADWVIDMGPDGGEKGGEIVACGTPEEIIRVKRSHTGKYLAKVLG